MACLVSNKEYLGCGEIWSWPFEAYLLADTKPDKSGRARDIGSSYAFAMKLIVDSTPQVLCCTR
jgi:hypothetical protein